MSTPKMLWQPTTEQVRQSQMFQFAQRIAQQHGIQPEWEPLRNWAIDNPGPFWNALIDFAGITPFKPAEAPLTGAGMLGTKWFPGMRLSYADHILRFNDEHPAIIFESELGRTSTYTHAELRHAVARCVAALQREGVQAGDRVAGYLPNIPETIIAMLAAATLGAIWSSCSPDFGTRAVLDRFGQIEPKVLITVDGYTYSGKTFPISDRIAAIVAELPSVERVAIVPYLEQTPPIDTLPRALWWDDWLEPLELPTPDLDFTEVPFDHPLFIMYSSGTTGKPKCIVHGHGGTLLQHMKELMLHCDLKRNERIFYFTTCGWMMWNWLVSGIGTGAAVVLYDGNPAYPDTDRLWKLAEKHQVNVFGTSPKFLGMCQKRQLQPGKQHDLSHLRAICSTGSPLSDELFDWTYEYVASDLMLASISGGTDIISCFMLGNPMLPVYAGEIQCRGLGMDVQAWNENEQPVIGEKGELVCATPFPSQPVGFWNDPENARYRDAYFNHYDDHDVWRHGDFIEITERGGVIVYGRSDATLNPGGVRIGTAEIYRCVEALDEVLDSIVVGKQTADQDVEIVLFVVLRDQLTLNDTLKQKIRECVAAGASKRHVPRRIAQVTEIPHTISGKKVELAVQQVLHGQPVKNRDALANPAALDQFAQVLNGA